MTPDTYYANNREKRLAYARIYAITRKDDLAKYNHEYYWKNRNTLIDKMTKRAQKNKMERKNEIERILHASKSKDAYKNKLMAFYLAHILKKIPKPKIHKPKIHKPKIYKPRNINQRYLLQIYPNK